MQLGQGRRTAYGAMPNPAKGPDPQMRTYDNSYSRFIAWVKVILPLAALGLLSTLFLFSRGSDGLQNLPYAQSELEQLAQEQGFRAPQYATVTPDGTAISLEADRAVPNAADTGQGQAQNLRGRLDFTDGGYAAITSAQGVIDSDQTTAHLSGNVEIETSQGYVIMTQELDTALNAVRLSTDTPVDIQSPMGNLTAGGLDLRPDENDPNSYVLVFNQGVKLIYDPQTSGDER